MDVTTAWLKPPAKAGGVDHLGVQQTPIRIFSTLLPGLTVVTDRVSNYSFYPWVAWAHDEDKGQPALDFIHILRRAECLLTLIAERHAQVRQEDEVFHSRGLVGRNTLVPALRNDAPRPIPLAELAALRSENPGSYFKNEYGGLGQYYLGPLRELGVLHRVGAKVEYSQDVGMPLAKALDARVDRKGFLRILKRGSVDEKDLDRLSAFCPCQLAAHAPERELLIDLLFARNTKPTPEDEMRRQTLLLLLDLALCRGDLGTAPLDAAFRAACLTGALDDGSSWSVPNDWRRVQRAWAIYERNDELSIAVLGIFWVALRLLDDRGGRANGTGEVAALVSHAVDETLKKRSALKLQDEVTNKAGSLPPLPKWYDPTHEFLLSIDIRNKAQGDDVAGCLIAALETLLAIAARHSEPHPYRDVAIPPDYLSDYPLNLASFHQKLTGEWRTQTLAQWAGILASEWGVEAHLRVALRKMHYESSDKFLLYATDDGLRRRQGAEPPIPSFTASRLNRAVQFLVDLGLAKWQQPGDSVSEEDPFSEARVARISPTGRQLREDLGG